MRRLPVLIKLFATAGEPPVLACAWNGAVWSFESSSLTVASFSWASRLAVERACSTAIMPIASRPSTSTSSGVTTVRRRGELTGIE